MSLLVKRAVFQLLKSAQQGIIEAREARELKRDLSRSKQVDESQLVIRVVETNSHPTKDGYVCLFSAYDQHSLVSPHVVFLLKSIRDLGFGICFVTTSPQLREDVVEQLSPLCWKIIHMQNLGRDYGAWKTGLRFIPALDNIECLVLANDSIYGPLFDLRSVFEKMDERSGDFWGITDSWDRSYHLQTYFVALKKPVLRSDAFKSFWKTFRSINNKRYIIDNGEIALTQTLLKAGFKPDVLCPYLAIRDQVTENLSQRDRLLELGLNLPSFRATVLKGLAPSQMTEHVIHQQLGALPLNATHFFWKELVVDFQCPFLKVELLSRNPSQIANVLDWRRVLKEKTIYDLSLIEQHLARVGLFLK